MEHRQLSSGRAYGPAASPDEGKLIDSGVFLLTTICCIAGGFLQLGSGTKQKIPSQVLSIASGRLQPALQGTTGGMIQFSCSQFSCSLW